MLPTSTIILGGSSVAVGAIVACGASVAAGIDVACGASVAAGAEVGAVMAVGIVVGVLVGSSLPQAANMTAAMERHKASGNHLYFPVSVSTKTSIHPAFRE